MNEPASWCIGAPGMGLLYCMPYRSYIPAIWWSKFRLQISIIIYCGMEYTTWHTVLYKGTQYGPSPCRGRPIATTSIALYDSASVLEITTLPKSAQILCSPGPDAVALALLILVFRSRWDQHTNFRFVEWITHVINIVTSGEIFSQ